MRRLHVIALCALIATVGCHDADQFHKEAAIRGAKVDAEYARVVSGGQGTCSVGHPMVAVTPFVKTMQDYYPSVGPGEFAFKVMPGGTAQVYLDGFRSGPPLRYDNAHVIQVKVTNAEYIYSTHPVTLNEVLKP